MIDPSDVIKFDRTDAELEEFWLFCCVVAGKTATTQARLLDGFLKDALRPHDEGSPFAAIRRLASMRGLGFSEDPLQWFLQRSRLGQYRRLTRCFAESTTLDLRNDPVERFETIHGVGPKTARMFLMHSRPNQRYAALDTHLLKHLASSGISVPKATPSSGKLYRRLEQEFLALVDASGLSVADYDLKVWKSYARQTAAGSQHP